MREVKAHTFEEVLETAKKKAAEFAAKPAEEQARILKQQEKFIKEEAMKADEAAFNKFKEGRKS